MVNEIKKEKKRPHNRAWIEPRSGIHRTHRSCAGSASPEPRSIFSPWLLPVRSILSSTGSAGSTLSLAGSAARGHLPAGSARWWEKTERRGHGCCSPVREGGTLLSLGPPRMSRRSALRGRAQPRGAARVAPPGPVSSRGGDRGAAMVEREGTALRERGYVRERGADWRRGCLRLRLRVQVEAGTRRRGSSGGEDGLVGPRHLRGGLGRRRRHGRGLRLAVSGRWGSSGGMMRRVHGEEKRLGKP